MVSGTGWLCSMVVWHWLALQHGCVALAEHAARCSDYTVSPGSAWNCLAPEANEERKVEQAGRQRRQGSQQASRQAGRQGSQQAGRQGSQQPGR